MKALQTAIVCGFDEFMDKRGHSGEADLQTLLTGCKPESQSNVDPMLSSWTRMQSLAPFFLSLVEINGAR